MDAAGMADMDAARHLCPMVLKRLFGGVEYFSRSPRRFIFRRVVTRRDRLTRTASSVVGSDSRGRFLT